MSIATEITRLQNAKASIKTAIENKGVTVPTETTLSGYDTLIDSIAGGVEEVATENEMTAKLTSANIGKYYKYTGTTGTYTNGDLYEVELVPTTYQITTSISGIGYGDYYGTFTSGDGEGGTATYERIYVWDNTEVGDKFISYVRTDGASTYYVTAGWSAGGFRTGMDTITVTEPTSDIQNFIDLYCTEV